MAARLPGLPDARVGCWRGGVVQAAWLRLSAGQDARDEATLFTTVTARLCLDELRSARRSRKTCIGP